MMDCISINSSFEFRLVKYVCPVCKEVKSIETPINSIKDNGLATISISKGTLCGHSFLAVINRGFKQRGSYTIDFTIPSENSTLNKKTKLSTLIPRLNLSKIIIKKN